MKKKNNKKRPLMNVASLLAIDMTIMPMQTLKEPTNVSIPIGNPDKERADPY
jgi:hypothetical protein